MRRRTVKILTGVGIVFVALGVTYAVAVAVSAMRLRQAYAALEGDGRPIKMSEVIPAPVPDTENAALLYQSAALLLKAQPAPEKNLLEYLGNLAKGANENSLDPNQQAELDRLLRRDTVGQAISIIEQGTQRPSCRFNNDYSAGLSMSLSHLSEMRELGRILDAKTLLQAGEGQTDDAWQTALTQLKFADALRTEPIIVSQLVRTLQISEACTTVQRLCERSIPNDRQSQDLQETLARYDDVVPFIRGIDGERLLFGEQTFHLPKGELRNVLSDIRGGDHLPWIASRLLLLRLSFKPLFLADHAAYLRAMRICAERFAQAHDPNEAEAMDREFSEIEKHHILTGILLPALGRVKTIYFRAIAEIRITRTGLTLLQRQSAQGEFPESLSAFQPDEIRDPFSQGSLRYKRQGTGFVLYSIGPDGKDNGGLAKERKQETDYDIVWHFSGQ